MTEKSAPCSLALLLGRSSPQRRGHREPLGGPRGLPHHSNDGADGGPRWRAPRSAAPTAKLQRQTLLLLYTH